MYSHAFHTASGAIPHQNSLREFPPIAETLIPQDLACISFPRIIGRVCL